MAKSKGPVRFKVRGKYPFPIDMLRYDGCIPDSERDSYAITATFPFGAERSELEVTLRSFHELRNGPTQGRWRSFGWEVVEIYDERACKFIPFWQAGEVKTGRDQAAVNRAVLGAMREDGLTFADCVKVFGVERDKDPFASAAKSRYGEEGSIEIDDHTVVSESEEPGPSTEGVGNAYVMAWVYVEGVKTK
jgi:hypothetical protein